MNVDLMVLVYLIVLSQNQMKNSNLLSIIFNSLLFKDINAIPLLDMDHVSTLIINIKNNMLKLFTIFIIIPGLFLTISVLLRFIIHIIINLYLNSDTVFK